MQCPQLLPAAEPCQFEAPPYPETAHRTAAAAFRLVDHWFFPQLSPAIACTALQAVVNVPDTVDICLHLDNVL